MSESKFKLGDKVRVLHGRRISNPSLSSNMPWEDGRNNYIGKIYTIKKLIDYRDSLLYTVDDVFWWPEEWLELVETAKATLKTVTQEADSNEETHYHPDMNVTRSNYAIPKIQVGSTMLVELEITGVDATKIYHNDWSYHKQIVNPKKGFDPENLTFDGRKIEAGDEVKVEKLGRFSVEEGFPGELGINLNLYFTPLQALNITNHYLSAPKKDEELEKLGAQLRLAENDLRDHPADDFGLDRYYQARKNLEDYKKENNIE